MTSTISHRCMVLRSTSTGVSGLSAIAALAPASRIIRDAASASPASMSRASQCTVTTSGLPSRYQGSWTKGLLIIRCTSTGKDVMALICAAMGTPMVRLGTKWPSMTSTCTQSAPPCSMSRISDSRFMKSEERMDGEILTWSNMVSPFSSFNPSILTRKKG